MLLMSQILNMNNVRNKPIILTFIGNYLPGYKQGGILRTIVNTVDYLCDDFEFKVVTRDRDFGDDEPYADIKFNQWQQVGSAMVYYLRPQLSTVKGILNLITKTPYHILYLNSFFDLFTIKVLLIRKVSWIKSSSVIVAPRGEFARGSLSLKYLKKIAYIQIARLFGIYNKVTWQASSEFEARDIIKVMKIKPNDVRIARDLPVKITMRESSSISSKSVSDYKGLKLIFLSRIAREKNLDYALKVLSKVTSRVVFDIYGPIEDTVYWKECQALIDRLPVNTKVNYLGCVSPNEVVNVFSHYDLFLFPTAGENYGHVIAESLMAGTPVLISDKTSWRDLETDGLGWSIDLAQRDYFVEIIERLALLSDDLRLGKREEVKAKIMERLLDPAVLEANRQLFKEQLLR